MCCNKKMIRAFWTGACFMLAVPVCAQIEDISIFENPNDNFLLPSYFDTPPTTYVQPTPSPVQPRATAPTQAPEDVDILSEIFGTQNPPVSQKQSTQHTVQTYYPSKGITSSVSTTVTKKKAPTLEPLPPIPAVPEQEILLPKKRHITSQNASKLLAKVSGKATNSLTMPKELKLKFEPNSTQLSSTTTKWITAYALHVHKDPRLFLNIHVSNQNWPIQQARLGLIIKLLIEKGLSSKQINVFQSNRGPDSIILDADLDPNQTKIITPSDSKQKIREQKTLEW